MMPDVLHRINDSSKVISKFRKLCVKSSDLCSQPKSDLLPKGHRKGAKQVTSRCEGGRAVYPRTEDKTYLRGN